MKLPKNTPKTIELNLAEHLDMLPDHTAIEWSDLHLEDIDWSDSETYSNSSNPQYIRKDCIAEFSGKRKKLEQDKDRCIKAKEVIDFLSQFNLDVAEITIEGDEIVVYENGECLDDFIINNN